LFEGVLKLDLLFLFVSAVMESNDEILSFRGFCIHFNYRFDRVKLLVLQPGDGQEESG